MGGTMRLGLYPAVLAEGSLVRELVRAGHGGGASPAPLRGEQRLPRARSRRLGLRCSGLSPDGRLVEFVELARDVHPYFVGHPGAPGVPVPAHPAAPALPRPGRGRAGAFTGGPHRRGAAASAGRRRARDPGHEPAPGNTGPGQHRGQGRGQDRGRGHEGRDRGQEPSGRDWTAAARRRVSSGRWWATRGCAPRCFCHPADRPGADARRASWPKRDVVEHPGRSRSWRSTTTGRCC